MSHNHSSSLSSSSTVPAGSNNNSTNKRARKPCSNCINSKVACDQARPCGRCTKQGRQSTCVDVPRKQRNKKPRDEPLSIDPNSHSHHHPSYSLSLSDSSPSTPSSPFSPASIRLSSSASAPSLTSHSHSLSHSLSHSHGLSHSHSVHHSLHSAPFSTLHVPRAQSPPLSSPSPSSTPYVWSHQLQSSHSYSPPSSSSSSPSRESPYYDKSSLVSANERGRVPNYPLPPNYYNAKLIPNFAKSNFTSELHDFLLPNADYAPAAYASSIPPNYSLSPESHYSSHPDVHATAAALASTSLNNSSNCGFVGGNYSTISNSPSHDDSTPSPPDYYSSSTSWHPSTGNDSYSHSSHSHSSHPSHSHSSHSAHSSHPSHSSNSTYSSHSSSHSSHPSHSSHQYSQQPPSYHSTHSSHSSPSPSHPSPPSQYSTVNFNIHNNSLTLNNTTNHNTHNSHINANIVNNINNINHIININNSNNNSPHSPNSSPPTTTTLQHSTSVQDHSTTNSSTSSNTTTSMSANLSSNFHTMNYHQQPQMAQQTHHGSYQQSQYESMNSLYMPQSAAPYPSEEPTFMVMMSSRVLVDCNVGFARLLGYDSPASLVLGGNGMVLLEELGPPQFQKFIMKMSQSRELRRLSGLPLSRQDPATLSFAFLVSVLDDNVHGVGVIKQVMDYSDLPPQVKSKLGDFL